MSRIRFKVVERENPRDRTGKKKFYATNPELEKVTEEELIEDLVAHTGLSAVDSKTAFYVMAYLLAQYVAQGKQADFGRLGSFFASISSAGKDSKKEVKAKDVFVNRIVFKPGPEIKEALKKVEFVDIDKRIR